MAQGPNAPYTKLDQNHITQRVFDEETDRLRVDAEVTATIGTIECIIDAASGDNIAIANQAGDKFLTINPDGSIPVTIASLPLPTGAATSALQTTGNVSLSSIDAKLPSGLTVSGGKLLIDGSGVVQPISASSLPLPTGAATEAKQDTANTSLASIDSKLTSPLTINLPANAATASNQVSGNASLTSIDSKLSGTIAIGAVSLPLPTGAATESTLSSIDSKLPTLGQKPSTGSVSVVLSSDSAILPTHVEAFTGANPDNIQLVGSIDGTKTGTKYGFVNNLRSQILAAHDRDQLITYADFGTKDQRITQIDYSSPTFSGFIARKSINYTPVGGKYRRDSIVWSIV